AAVVSVTAYYLYNIQIKKGN
ncbi:hypothetical protein GPU96_09g18050, partial [Encephalitozoon hellem]